MNPGTALRRAVNDATIPGGCVAWLVDACFGNLNFHARMRMVSGVVPGLFERRELNLHLCGRCRFIRLREASNRKRKGYGNASGLDQRFHCKEDELAKNE